MNDFSNMMQFGQQPVQSHNAQIGISVGNNVFGGSILCLAKIFFRAHFKHPRGTSTGRTGTVRDVCPKDAREFYEFCA